MAGPSHGVVAYTDAMSERLSMRKVREVLRLKYESGHIPRIAG